jgi:AbrB family looped-hinge helix DNA binding protein
MRTTVSSRGQTAVPAAVRKRFKLTGRSRLEWIIEGDVITLLPVPADPARAFRGALRGRYSGAALLRDRRKERERERARG